MTSNTERAMQRELAAFEAETENYYDRKKEQSGFFTLPKQDVCLDPGHAMPTHLYIPAGQGYKHTCPRCGKVSVAHGATASF